MKIRNSILVGLMCYSSLTVVNAGTGEVGSSEGPQTEYKCGHHVVTTTKVNGKFQEKIRDISLSEFCGVENIAVGDFREKLTASERKERINDCKQQVLEDLKSDDVDAAEVLEKLGIVAVKANPEKMVDFLFSEKVIPVERTAEEKATLDGRKLLPTMSFQKKFHLLDPSKPELQNYYASLRKEKDRLAVVTINGQQYFGVKYNEFVGGVVPTLSQLSLYQGISQDLAKLEFDGWSWIGSEGITIATGTLPEYLAIQNQIPKFAYQVIVDKSQSEHQVILNFFSVSKDGEMKLIRQSRGPVGKENRIKIQNSYAEDKINIVSDLMYICEK